jgi:aquaporin Z
MKNDLVEFIGTFFIVFTIGMGINELLSSFAPVAAAAAYITMIYAGKHISGGHYNPAVTLAVHIRGLITTQEAIAYVVFQLLGGMFASFFVWWFTGHQFFISPGPAFSPMMQMGAEALGTFAIAYVMLNVTTHPKTEGNSYYGIAIGLAFLSMSYIIGPISGGTFNLVTGVCPNIFQVIIGDTSNLRNIWVYFVGPLAGGAAAGYTYKFINS